MAADIDKALVANLLRINGLDEHRPFREHLIKQKEFWVNALVSQRDMVAIHQSQGRIQAYQDLLEILAKAPVLAEKYRE